MKALFNQFNGAHSNVKDPWGSDSDSDSPISPSFHMENLPQLHPLSLRPIPLEQPHRSIDAPTSITSYEPLPESSTRSLARIEVTLVPFTDYHPISIPHPRGPLLDIVEEDPFDTASPRVDQDTAGRSSPKTGDGSITTANGNNNVPKKVAFPPRTLSGLNADRPLPEDASTLNNGTLVRSQPSHTKDPRGSMSTAASGPRPGVGSSKHMTRTIEATLTSSVTSYSAKPAATIHQSLHSATPFSQKPIGSVLPPSWREGVEEDLVTHLGLREGTPEKVLWEIVSSEERYVAELLKMKDTFIVPILHPECDDMFRLDTGVAPHQLPEYLRQCLEVIENSILAGHLKLSQGLRKLYDERYPLVRSLADIFFANSHILWGYADYVLHLERALEQVNDVISMSNSTRWSKNKDADEWLKVCIFLRKLEDRGETGLAISLSMPFQRLLKYPLLFQNLLSHTDPSTFQYDSILRMVARVENILRSIEDKKIQIEERDKTRDILARIDGMDKVKQLAAPNSSRVLVEERKLELSDAVGTSKAVKGKTSFNRLSDVLQDGGGGIGGKTDMWLVVFNDVVLRCQRTGMTWLPLGSASRASYPAELQGKSKFATTDHRNSTIRLRNMYKFIKIENWTLDNSAPLREGVVSMEEVIRARAQIHSAVQPRILPMQDDDDDDDDKSKSSFSNWGAGKITFQKPVTKPASLCSGESWTNAKSGHGLVSADSSAAKPILKQQPGPGGLGTRRNGPIVPSGYSRESSANAKSGHRLVSAGSSAARPSTRRTVTSSGRRPAAPLGEGHSINVTVTRPAWDGSKRTSSTSVQSTKNDATRTSTTPPNETPAEDSGVGLYRQMMENDLSLHDD